MSGPGGVDITTARSLSISNATRSLICCQTETLAALLRQHSGIEIVARDRAGACADGIRQGAPDAIQVCDRWHLLRNLGDAVRAVIDRHYGDLRRSAKQMKQPIATSPT